MPDEDNVQLSVEEEAALRHEELVAKILRIRNQEEPKKSPWRSFFESSGGAALITVLLGGIFTTIITGIIQHYTQERSFQNEMIKIYGADRLEVKRAQLQGQLEVLTAALQQAGKARAIASSKIDVEGPSFYPRTDKEEEKKNEEQRQSVKAQFNAIWLEWDTSKVAIRGRLFYYFGEGSSKRWESLVGAVDQLFSCAKKLNRLNYPTISCGTNESDVDTQMRGFLGSLPSNYQPVVDWMSPGDINALRKLLEE